MTSLVDALAVKMAVDYAAVRVEADRLAALAVEIANTANEHGAPFALTSMTRHAAKQLLAAVERGDVTMRHIDRLVMAQDVCLTWIEDHHA